MEISRLEGIIPALESSHAICTATKMAPRMSKRDFIVVTLSGRGDKDVDIIVNEPKYLDVLSGSIPDESSGGASA